MLMAMAGSVFFYNMETGKSNIGYPVFYAQAPDSTHKKNREADSLPCLII